MLFQKETIKLLLTCLDDLAMLVEAFDVKISGRALVFINVDVHEVSRGPGNQMVGQFVELVDGVM